MADQTEAEKKAEADRKAVEAEHKKAEADRRSSLGKGKKQIRYVGSSDERRITAADFRKAGIESEKVSFSRSNNWRMTDEGLSPDAVEYFDSQDDGFVVTDID